MNTTGFPPPQQQVKPPGDNSRFWSKVLAAAFLPLLLITGFAALGTEQASVCIEYGDGCKQGLPGGLFLWGFLTAICSWAVVMGVSALRVRQVAAVVQGLAEALALAVVVSYV